jgi:hypothetical protein
MSTGIIIAIGILVGAAIGIALVAIRRAGGECGPEDYGHELDAPPMQGRRGRYGPPGSRQRAMLVGIAAALAALGAALATGLGHH